MAGNVAKVAWSAPPLRIQYPVKLGKGRRELATAEISPAILMMGAGLFGLYIWARKNNINPFDWLWKRVDDAAENLKTTIAQKTPAQTTTIDPVTGDVLEAQYTGVIFTGTGKLPEDPSHVLTSMVLDYKSIVAWINAYEIDSKTLPNWPTGYHWVIFDDVSNTVKYGTDKQKAS